MYSQYSEVIPQRETERPFKSYAHSTPMSSMPPSGSGYYGMAHMSAHQMLFSKKECGYSNGMSMSASPQDFSMSLPLSIRGEPHAMRGGESVAKGSELIHQPPVTTHMDSSVNQTLPNDMGINMIMDDIMKSNKQSKHENGITSIVDAIMTNKPSNHESECKFQDPTTSSSSNGLPPTENLPSSNLEEKPSEEHFRMPPKKRPLSVPDESKDELYWEKRLKNNESAKRSREARRMKEEQIAVRVVYLEQENLQLRTEVTLLKSEIEKLRCMLYSS